MAAAVFTLFSLALLVGIVGGAVASFFIFSLMWAIAFVLIGIPLLAWLSVVLYGVVRRAQPLRPFDAVEHARNAESLSAEGRYVTMPDGRIVEYLIYGSKKNNAKVIVQIHGASSSAGWQCRMNASLLEALNLKGIAPSMPGYGYSDLYVGRLIKDFPKDVEAILDAEGVDQFMVEGISLGTSHAMAVAWAFGPQRCVGLGLNVPYLSEAICREFDFQHDADKLPKKDARHWYQAWNFFVADLMFIAPVVSPMARLMHLFLPEGERVRAERPWVFEMLREDQKRVVIRGTQGQGYDQFSYEMNALWGFDPRDIETKNVAVWYALDDSACPPTHGKWLAEMFGSKLGVKTDIRAEDLGLGHFTYTPSTGPAFDTSERNMPKALLDLAAA
jgi:pimeloyl-ACP methyl ester carboxylesterase